MYWRLIWSTFILLFIVCGLFCLLMLLYFYSCQLSTGGPVEDDKPVLLSIMSSCYQPRSAVTSLWRGAIKHQLNHAILQRVFTHHQTSREHQEMDVWLAADPRLTKHGENSAPQRHRVPLDLNRPRAEDQRESGRIIIASAGRFRPGNNLHNSLLLSLPKYVPNRSGKLGILSSKDRQIRQERTKREYSAEPQK